jgi:hypothetical protein
VLTSSPAFVVNYFAKYGQSRAPIRIVENRYFEPGAPLRPESIPEAEVTVQATDAIAIGWFGIPAVLRVAGLSGRVYTGTAGPLRCASERQAGS